MKIECPACQAPFEADPAPAAGPGLRLCDACSRVGDAPPPPIAPTQRPEALAEPVAAPVAAPSRRRRPKLPELSFRQDEPTAEVVRAESPPADAPAPPPSSAPAPISPPPQASSTLVPPAVKRVPPIAPPPLAAANTEGSRDAADSGIVDLRRIIASAERRLAGHAAPPQEAAREKPSYFRVDSIPPASPSLIPVDFLDEPPPSSSRADLQSLVALPSDRPRARAAAELLNLDGGLFGHASSLGLLPPPDASLLTAPLAPVMSPDRVSRSSVRPVDVDVDVDLDDAPRSGDSTPAPLPLASKISRSGAPAPVVSERRPAAIAARRGGIASWAVVLCSVAAASVALGFRLGATQPARVEAREAGVGTAILPPAATPPEPPIAHAFVARSAEIPAPPPLDEKRQAPAPPAPVSRPVEPRAAEPTRAVERERVVPAPVPSPAVVPPPPPVVAAPTPAPAGGAEFDRGAARTALASAASAAAGCKQGDDPSGGARVSVTFAPSGRVTSARIVSGPFQGTKTGGCIAQTFRAASVPAFSGDPVTVAKEISVQ